MKTHEDSSQGFVISKFQVGEADQSLLTLQK